MTEEVVSYEKVINNAIDFVKSEIGEETTGHDWWHSYRVWKNALLISKEADVDIQVVELAALLHDVGDWKISGGDKEEGPKKIRNFLNTQSIEKDKIDHIVDIISSLAYVAPGKVSKMKTKEGEIVQDSDRLEALGAVGIARTFATGHKFNQLIYDPNIKPNINQSEEDYKKQYTGEKKNTTINHFYEKLFLIKDHMNTETAKKIAIERHEFMELFLDRFYLEWEGKK